MISSIALNFILKSVMMSSLSLGLILLKEKGRCPEIESKEKVSLSTFAICKEFRFIDGTFYCLIENYPPPQKKACGHPLKH